MANKGSGIEIAWNTPSNAYADVLRVRLKPKALEANRDNKNIYYIVLMTSGSLKVFTAFLLNFFCISVMCERKIVISGRCIL